MGLHDEIKDASGLMELLQIKKKFVDSDDVHIALGVILQDLMEYFHFDRVFIGMKLFSDQQCVPLAEYIKGEATKYLGKVVSLNEFSKFADVQVGKTEREYIELADENLLVLEKEYATLSALLSEMGYVPNDKGTPKESLLFYNRTADSFSYMIMERYEKYEMPFSPLETMFLSTIYDILKLRVNEQTLVERISDVTDINNAILENENVPVCMVDKEHKRVLYCNEEYKTLVGTVTIGQKYEDIFSDPRYLGENYNTELLHDSESLVHYTVDDKITYLIKKVVPLTLSSGGDVFLVYIKNTADYIRRLEGIDLLTSAYSMKGFTTYYKQYIKNKDVSNYMLCAMDISKFKYVNDTQGFETGNKVLQKMVEVLGRFTRDQETFCRINADRFALLLECDSNGELEARIKNLFEKLELMGSSEFPDIELSYVCGAIRVDPNIEMNMLIDKANMSRKKAKGSHANVLSIFDDEMERKLANEKDIESRITGAIINSEFVPYLQPKFNLNTMEICGAEALVRWVTPTGMIFPDNFIPLFEKNGFITTLDFIIYDKVMAYIRKCLDSNMKVYPISVNVSRNHIQNENFAEQILELMDKYQIPVELLELEITENVFIEDKEVLKFFVETVKHIKIKVSIDDFGTAYSSLQVLKDMNMDILKIDKGFLDNIRTDNEFAKDELVLKNVIHLAKDLQCKVVCEGVETEKQIEILKKIGCDVGQGYVFARPMPFDEYDAKYLTKGK